MSKLTKTFKGQISHETEKAVEISIMTDTEMFNAWIPKSALNMKEMKENYLTVTGIQEFHIKQWFVDSKAKEENTKTEFLEKADEITTEAPKPAPKTTVIDMPSAPTPDRVEYPYFPGMTIFELRDYHKNEPIGAIRGHIENLIEDRKRYDVLISIEKRLKLYFEGKGK